MSNGTGVCPDFRENFRSQGEHFMASRVWHETCMKFFTRLPVAQARGYSVGPFK